MFCFSAIGIDETVNMFIHEPASVSQTTQLTVQIRYCHIFDASI